MLTKSMETCVEVLHELKKIDETKRRLLLRRAREKDRAAYTEITNLLTLLERED
mgnify:CR=1